ncbi:MAG TPA: redoxin family protein [Caldimonas sp.]|nr:redoxin family protein [Caldimonas sp.]HEX2541374.1 redoxin family protein [Caldimonas sp.]
MLLGIEAPEIEAESWLNTPTPLALRELRGQVVALHAFQMLCPGCVSHGIPQATRIERLFAGQDVRVIGLHSVFEHHQAMGRTALEAFVHQYRLTFPIAVDRPAAEGSLPRTLLAYRLQGTPSLVLIDRAGRIRLSEFGAVEDMSVGAMIGALLSE